jgi:hypothetical protein
LIDAFVSGSASKKDKLSEVTIDFYNNATVDLNTGALVRRYDVALSSPWATQSFEQSPTYSQSSGFSPAMYTPSPASSATFGDSGYGSISMTPPTQNRGSRVTKVCSLYNGASGVIEQLLTDYRRLRRRPKRLKKSAFQAFPS